MIRQQSFLSQLCFNIRVRILICLRRQQAARAELKLIRLTCNAFWVLFAVANPHHEHTHTNAKKKHATHFSCIAWMICSPSPTRSLFLFEKLLLVCGIFRTAAKACCHRLAPAQASAWVLQATMFLMAPRERSKPLLSVLHGLLTL